LQNENTELKLKIKEFENNMEKTQEKAKILENNYKNSNNDVDELKNQNVKLEENINLLQNELSALKNSYSQLQEENENLQNQIKAKENELNSVSKNLNENYIKTNENLQEIQSQNEKLNIKNADLSKEFDKLKKEKLNIEQEKDELSEKLHQLEKDNKKLKSDLNAYISQAENKQKDAENQNEDLYNENERLKAKLGQEICKEEEYTSKIQELEKARDSYKDQYMSAKKINKELKKKLDSIEGDVQLFIKQREIEMYENMRKEEEEKLKEASRIEALKDVRGKITQFKSDRAMRSTSPSKSFSHKK